MGNLDLEAIRAKLNQLSGVKRTSNVQMWKADVGDYRIRILPWKNTKPGAIFEERQFYYLGDGPGILAPAQFGKPDPVNDLIKQLYATRSQEDRQLAKSIMPRMRAYAAIIVRGDEEKGPIVWSFNKKIYQDLLGFVLDSDYGDITDIDNGFDVKVKITLSPKTFNGRKFNDITVSCSPKSTPLSNDPALAKKWLDAVPNIDDMWQLKSYDEIKSMLERFLEGGQEGVIGSEQAEASAKKQNDELSKLEEEIKSVASEKKADASPDKKSSRRTSDAKAAIERGFNDLDAALADLEAAPK